MQRALTREVEEQQHRKDGWVEGEIHAAVSVLSLFCVHVLCFVWCSTDVCLRTHLEDTNTHRHAQVVSDLVSCRESLRSTRMESARRQRALQTLQSLGSAGLLRGSTQHSSSNGECAARL